MAQAIRFTVFDKQGDLVLKIEPRWWDISTLDEVAGPFRWTMSNDVHGYTDEHVDISQEAARKLHKHFRHKLVDDIKFAEHSVKAYANDVSEYGPERHRLYVDHLAELQSQLDGLDRVTSALASDTANFHLCIFDWESGL